MSSQSMNAIHSPLAISRPVFLAVETPPFSLSAILSPPYSAAYLLRISGAASEDPSSTTISSQSSGSCDSTDIRVSSRYSAQLYEGIINDSRFSIFYSS